MTRRKPVPRDDLTTVLRVVRLGFVLLLVLLTMLYVIRVGASPIGEFEIGLAINWWVSLLAALVLAIVFLAIDIFTPIKKIQIISGVVFGLLSGLVAAWAIGAVIDLVIATWDIQPTPIVPTIKILLGVSLAYLGITTVLQTQDEFRLVIPYVEFAKQIRGPRPVLLDTSALIDGRIADIAASGLVQQPIVIPAFVLEELQTLADSQDRTRRARGRRGLDMVTRLQGLGTADVSIDTTPVSRKAVDQMLVQLAMELPATIMTTDSGLARVASIKKVAVVNLHELGNALRPGALPGQVITVELIRRGEHAGQGVGFLEDGTMVVAEDGQASIGRTVEVTLTSSMQTAAGRLLFARVGPEEAVTAPEAVEAPASDQPERGPLGPARPDGDRPTGRNPRR